MNFIDDFIDCFFGFFNCVCNFISNYIDNICIGIGEFWKLILDCLLSIFNYRINGSFYLIGCIGNFIFDIFN